jgi:hypothetical protein
MMNVVEINSNRGRIDLPLLYIGWMNNHKPTLHETDCGDEIFGLAIGKFYIGYYEDGKWCAGFLDTNGCLN